MLKFIIYFILGFIIYNIINNTNRFSIGNQFEIILNPGHPVPGNYETFNDFLTAEPNYVEHRMVWENNFPTADDANEYIERWVANGDATGGEFTIVRIGHHAPSIYVATHPEEGVQVTQMQTHRTDLENWRQGRRSIGHCNTQLDRPG